MDICARFSFANNFNDFSQSWCLALQLLNRVQVSTERHQWYRFSRNPAHILCRRYGARTTASLLRDEPVLAQLQITSNVPWPIEVVSVAVHDTDTPPEPTVSSHPRLVHSAGLSAAAGVTLHPTEELVASARFNGTGSSKVGRRAMCMHPHARPRLLSCTGRDILCSFFVAACSPTCVC